MKEHLKCTQSSNLRILVTNMVLVFFSMSGCSTMEHSMFLGAGTGAVMGAGTGFAVGGDNQTESTLIGLGIGAIVGGITSYVIHGAIQKRDDTVRRDTLFNLENHGVVSRPTGQTSLSDIGSLITMPEVEEDWIDTHVDGKKLVEGHRIWSLIDGSRWDLSASKLQKRKK